MNRCDFPVFRFGRVVRAFVLVCAASMAGAVLSGCDKSTAAGSKSDGTIRLEAMPLEGADAIAIMGINVVKYRITDAPEGQLYKCRFWAERFTKGHSTAQIIELPSTSFAVAGSTILFTIPWMKPGNAVWVLNSHGSISRSEKEMEALLPGGTRGVGDGTTAIVNCSPGKPAIITKGWSLDGPGSYTTGSVESMIATNDVSVILYISFTPAKAGE